MCVCAVCKSIDGLGYEGESQAISHSFPLILCNRISSASFSPVFPLEMKNDSQVDYKCGMRKASSSFSLTEDADEDGVDGANGDAMHAIASCMIQC